MADNAGVDKPSSSKQNWVCPNDRHLALRAKLRKGWSVKTQDPEGFQKETPPLNDDEQESIRAVIRRAEEFEIQEQERVGRIMERLDNMRHNAVGTGVDNCVLCGTRVVFLGIISTACLICQDCKKAVCQKCGVESTPNTSHASTSSGASSSQASSSKKGNIWRCKICAETREMWKKSGAWFFKGIPKYILPQKKFPPPTESKFSPRRRSGYEKSNWALALRSRPSDVEEESSSDEDRATKFLASRTKKPEETTTGKQYLRNEARSEVACLRSSASTSYPLEIKHSILPPIDGIIGLHDLEGPPNQADEQKQMANKGCKFKKGGYKRETSESSESGGSTAAASQYHRTYSNESGGSKGSLYLPRNSTSYNGDQAHSLDTEIATAHHVSPSFQYSSSGSPISLQPTREWYSEFDRMSLSGSSLSGYKNVFDDTTEDQAEGVGTDKYIGTLGTIELTLLYDSVACSVHASLHRARNLKPMDINGLADPFCKLNILPSVTKSHRLRTRTVHKTRNPEFNETLTFYGVTEFDMATKALHIIVFDDDKYGYDFMGETKFCLERLRPDVSRQFSFYLEKHYPVDNEEFVWGDERSSHGQILITLCFNTRRKVLIVGIVRCTNLAPMDNNGFSDPFVKLFLKPDMNNKKYKTSVKWKNLNPIFNEEFAFETKMQELLQQTLIISVWDKDYGKSNDYLGCLELSCKSKGERLRHWIDMIKFPDHKHEGWHNLCEDQSPPQ